jgi:hypothetical protein
MRTAEFAWYPNAARGFKIVNAAAVALAVCRNSLRFIRIAFRQ